MHGLVPPIPPPNASDELELRRVRVDLLRTQLKVGLTLLDVAVDTTDKLRRHRCVLSAMAILEAASPYCGRRPFEIQDIQDIQQQYRELRDRLLMTVNGRAP